MKQKRETSTEAKQRSNSPDFGSEKHRKLSFLSTRLWGLLLVGVLIFELGLNIGNGRITVSFASAGQNKNLPNRLDYASVDQVYTLVKNNYDGKLTSDQLLDGLKQGLAEATNDPYTEYFNPSQAKDFNRELNGSFSGIGAELGKNANDNLIVVAPIDGSPAAKAGLKAQDIITNIDGASTNGISIDSAVTKIRGPKGTKVTLKILRGKTDLLSLTITRDDIRVPSVKSEILDDNIGYLQINQFSDDTTNLTLKAAQKFKQANVKGVIVDIRDNPGGLLDAAVNVSSLWLPTGKTILSEKHDGTVVQTYTATGNNVLDGIPTVVLINGGSASAAEITAGALHDNHVAQLIGAKSFGKGSVQEIDKLAGGGELKVTIAHWFRPNGQSINHTGITPDQTVQISDSQIKAGQDPQKDAAITWLKEL